MTGLTHGMTGTPAYHSWSSMRTRCLNTKDFKYPSYGGRGIKICDRWLESFENFYEDMGDRPEGLTLDRKDNDGDYTLENCRWATPTEQSSNRRSNILITVDDKTLTAMEWSRILGGNDWLVSLRIRRGWSPKDAATTPPGQQP